MALTHVFPNLVRPRHAPFHRHQLEALGRRCDLDVVAPIPWFPGATFGGERTLAGRLGQLPRESGVGTLSVLHPRYLETLSPSSPSFGALYAMSLLPRLRRLTQAADVLFASWAYPDGVAAVIFGSLFRKPVVMQVIGSDLNVLSHRWGPRMNLRWALPRVSRLVAVSRALADRAVDLGADPRKVVTLPTGVDREHFYPRDRAECRQQLDLTVKGQLVLFVGQLKREKGIFELLDAWEQIVAQGQDATLALVGDGSARAVCEARAAESGGHLVVIGSRPHEEIPLWLGACDLFTLPSWREGTPNVVLEALASGRRIVATRVGGIPDLVSGSQRGLLVPPQNSSALAQALAQALDQSDGQAEIAEAFVHPGWEEQAERLHEVLATVADTSSE